MATVAISRACGLGRRLPRRQRGPSPSAAGAVRHIRSGYFPEDLDYIDPEGPLLAERLGMRWRYMDDPALKAPVLERNNVGMGMLVLNRSQGLDLPTVNTLYTRLRNLEVNSYKRFVGLTAAEPGPFSVGLDSRELLLAATCALRQNGALPNFSRALLWNSQELAHLIADFRKPIVSQMSGVAMDNGAAMGCLGYFAGAHEESELKVDACFAGLVPAGGLCYVLGKLKWHLGEYLALTGRPVRGVDLVYAGLVQHWISPDALPFLELTAEKQLEVSEADGRMLLDEHSLLVPDVLRDATGRPSPDSIMGVAPLVRECFAGLSIHRIKNKLREMSTEGGARKAFADDCLERMSRASPIALHTTLELIRKARAAIEVEASSEQARTAKRFNVGSRQDKDKAHQRAPGFHGEEGALAQVLQLELRALHRLLGTPGAAKGLHARCLGMEVEWPADEVVPQDVDDLLRGRSEIADLGEMPDLNLSERSEFPLSTHPLLRRYHPDYDAATGLDHEPSWAAQEAARWSPDFYARERRQAIDALLEGQDPARYGLSRWTRVEPAASPSS